MPLLNLTGFEHVGIRVSDKARALAFYGDLGFEVEWDPEDSDGIELIHPTGLRVHLIANGVAHPKARNILLDDPVKFPGVTHPAYVVPDLDAAMAAVEKAGIRITEGPNDEPRRRYFFIRDPDGNVLEFNELKPKL